MKRTAFILSVLWVFVFVFAVAFDCRAINIRGDQNFTGEVNFDGDLKLKGTKVTATADELNILDGVTATAAELNALTDAPAPGVQAEALGTNEVGTVAVENSQVNITGPTNADTAVITLTAPTSAQLGQSVVIYNAGTNTLSIVYATGSTNDVAASNLMLVHASSTNGWYYLEIPALDSELTKLALKDGGSLTNLNGGNLASGNILIDRLTNAIPVKLSRNDGSGLTNMAPATAFPGYAVCIVTNLDLDGTTNILTYIGTVARGQ